MGFLGSAVIESVCAGNMKPTSIEASDVRMSSLGSKGSQYEVLQKFWMFSHLASHNNSQNLSAVVASPGSRQASPMTAIESISTPLVAARSVRGIGITRNNEQLP